MGRKRLRVTKKACLRKHAKRRALTRFNMRWTREDFESIIHQIHTHQAVLLEYQTTRVSKWIVEHRGVLMQVVYDRPRRTIVTCMYVHKWMIDFYNNSKSVNLSA